MCMKQHVTLVEFTLWSLLAIWTAFGLCEFSEAVELLDETSAEEATHQDLDEEALARLASAVKSDVPVFDSWHVTSSTITSASPPPASSALSLTLRTSLAAHDPPGLPLYQQFSIYRI